MTFGTKLLNLLFPPHCPLCGKIQDEVGVCPLCQQTAPWIGEDVAPATGEFFDSCYAPLWYTGLAKTSFHRYKFSNRKEYHKFYAKWMVQSIEGRHDHSFDCVTWAPLHRWRLRRRGYDQSKLLAHEIAKELELPVVSLLIKCRNTSPQSTLHDVAERRANSMGAYRMAKGVTVSNLRVLLVDDVLTTGSTLSECARILRTHGATSVDCVALARADHIPKQLK